jgi:hypothetical protein
MVDDAFLTDDTLFRRTPSKFYASYEDSVVVMILILEWLTCFGDSVKRVLFTRPTCSFYASAGSKDLSCRKIK